VKKLFFILICLVVISHHLNSQVLVNNVYSISKFFNNDQPNAVLYLGSISNTGIGTYGKITTTAHYCNQLFIAEFDFQGTYYAGSNTSWIQLPLAKGNDWYGSQSFALDVRIVGHGEPFEIRLRRLSGAGCGGGTIHFRIETNGIYTENISEGSASQIPLGYLGKTNGWQFPVSNDRFNSSENGLFIKNTGNVGICTINPEDKFEVAGGGITISNNQYYRVRFNGGTPQSVIGMTSSNVIRVGDFTNSWNTELSGASALSFLTQGTTRMVLSGDNVGIGTTTPSEKLSVNGNIKAKKLIVTQTGWPDYVFAKNYKLRSINEVEDFIAVNKHLPEMPSAKDVEEKGLDIGKTQAVLLKKIEELTLYIIEQDRKINTQGTLIKKLMKSNR
jgi:hypothetical protein